MALYYGQLTWHKQAMFLVSSERGLVFVGTPGKPLNEIDAFFKDISLVHDQTRVQAAADQLQQYFDGHETLDIPVDFISGTPLQQQVWRMLQQVPRGTTWTYSQLADAVGKPQAVRAVASAVGKNPITVVVPCHRIIRKNGDIGQYRGGVAMKRTLLTMEGAI
ncbi:methylated-DNA--[protein]-cysteine S-methyltransferase [Lacticaseibacillus saniviri]